MNSRRTMLAPAIFASALFWGACGDGKTKVLDAGSAELTLQVFSDFEGGAPLSPYASLSFPVSSTEAVDLHRVVLVFNHVEFAATGHDDSDGAQMSPATYKAASGEDDHSDMMELEEAGPFVVDLGTGITQLGTFMVPPETYGMVNLYLSPLDAAVATGDKADMKGMSVFLEGTYSSDTTSVPFEARLQLDAGKELKFQQMAKLEGHVLGAIRVRTHGWFDELDLKSALVTTAEGTRIEVSGSGDLARALFDRVADSFSFGVDLNGDGAVSDDELLTDMPSH